MKSSETLFKELGYQITQSSDRQITFTQYDQKYFNLTEDKRPYRRIVVDLQNKTVKFRGKKKPQRDNFPASCYPPMSVKEIEAVYQLFYELGWCSNYAT
jgi:hypothetical protein